MKLDKSNKTDANKYPFVLLRDIAFEKRLLKVVPVLVMFDFTRGEGKQSYFFKKFIYVCSASKRMISMSKFFEMEKQSLSNSDEHIISLLGLYFFVLITKSIKSSTQKFRYIN